jgi:hypothetical protein
MVLNRRIDKAQDMGGSADRRDYGFLAHLYSLSATVITRAHERPQPILMRKGACDVQFMVFPG